MNPNDEPHFREGMADGHVQWTQLIKEDDGCVRHLPRWNWNEMARLFWWSLEGERDYRFSAAPSTPTYANLALKITTTALVQLNQNYRETSSHGWCWCLWMCAFHIRIKALSLHKKLSCVVIIMIVTWSMGIFFNDVHLHHHLQWCFAHWSFALFCNK